MNSRIWLIGFIVLVIMPLTIAASLVIKVDPYFHYHKPEETKFYYSLNNERSQNDGILRHFDYEGIITGTSMTQCFKTTDAERIYGCTFVKVPYSGASYKEINDILELALDYNKGIGIIIRGLDMSMFIQDKDAMRYDMGDYPTYLYDRNLLNDVEYVLNRDVVFKTVYKMVEESNDVGFKPGITPFDVYSNWTSDSKFGVNSVFSNGIPSTDRSVEQQELTEKEKTMILENARQNITRLAEKYPNVTFCYFFTPYSAAWWQSLINSGTFDKQIQAEKIVIEEILKNDNIKLFSFNNITEITADLNNYTDTAHYAEWVNGLMLRYMKEGKCLLTDSNYLDYLEKEKAIYSTFDYEECFNKQKDYDNDEDAALVIEKSANIISPRDNDATKHY